MHFIKFNLNFNEMIIWLFHAKKSENKHKTDKEDQNAKDLIEFVFNGHIWIQDNLERIENERRKPWYFLANRFGEFGFN